MLSDDPHLLVAAGGSGSEPLTTTVACQVLASEGDLAEEGTAFVLCASDPPRPAQAGKEVSPGCLGQQSSGLACAHLRKGIPWSPTSPLQLPGATYPRGILEAQSAGIGCRLSASGTCSWAGSSLSRPSRRPPGSSDRGWSTWGQKVDTLGWLAWCGVGTGLMLSPSPSPGPGHS